MARVKDGTVEAKEAYMKSANKALFAPLLKPGDLAEAAAIDVLADPLWAAIEARLPH
jgi:hypothetical protein